MPSNIAEKAPATGKTAGSPQSQTAVAWESIQDWIRKASNEENDFFLNATDLEERANGLKDLLEDPKTMMTPGLYTCRAIQRHCKPLLDMWQEKQGRPEPYPDLNNAENWSSWDRNIRAEIAECLEAKFGPLYEEQTLRPAPEAEGNDTVPSANAEDNAENEQERMIASYVTWKTLLERRGGENRVGTKSEIYKLAIAFQLSKEEIARLFLLYRCGYNPHDPQDIAFECLYQRFPDSLRWADVMEVLVRYQNKVGASDLSDKIPPQGVNTGTQSLHTLIDELQKERVPGEDAFKSILVKKLVENKAYIDPITIVQMPLTADFNQASKVAGYVKPDPKNVEPGTVAIYSETKFLVNDDDANEVGHENGCAAAEPRERTVIVYEHSSTAVKALNGMLRQLTVLYPMAWKLDRKDHGSFTEYPTVDGLPKKPSDLFNTMLDSIGASRVAARDRTKPMFFFSKRLTKLNADYAASARLWAEGQLPHTRSLDHDDVLLLTWFYVQGVLSGEHEEALEDLLDQTLDEKDPDLFSTHTDRILKEINAIQSSSTTKERLTHIVETFDLVLNVFTAAGLRTMSSIYLPRPMDRMVVATLLYAQDEVFLLDLIDYMLNDMSDDVPTA